ncbi:helix-turn-helix transcriptional regulator [Nocardiopsis sp. NPDC049922]|uniref:helix-turn-helix domain-containing protein n=1 Tax=Nocardiopsis sp. NPDC049922 TaxID=3155157 RepID=UPI0033E33FE6
MPEPPFPELLTQLREIQGLSQERLARLVSNSEASVSRWVNGRGLPKRNTAENLDKILKADGRLFAAWKLATSGNTLPEWARDIAAIEESALTVQSASPVLVPGYLQSTLYAQAVFRAWWPLASDEEIARLTKIRTGRLAQLPRLRVTAVFPVSAVTGFAEEIRREQAVHLLDLAEEERVDIHLVPEGLILVGVTSPLLVFRLRSGELAVSSDHACGNVIHEAEDHDRLTSLITGALAVSLPERHSIEALKELA